MEGGYQQIESDLPGGLYPLVRGAVPHRLRRGSIMPMPGAALTLVLARLYLYWNRMEEAEAVATEAMNFLGLRTNGDGFG